jgi:hypothetical protein
VVPDEHRSGAPDGDAGQASLLVLGVLAAVFAGVVVLLQLRCNHQIPG